MPKGYAFNYFISDSLNPKAIQSAALMIRMTLLMSSKVEDSTLSICGCPHCTMPNACPATTAREASLNLQLRWNVLVCPFQDIGQRTCQVPILVTKKIEIASPYHIGVEGDAQQYAATASKERK